MPVRIEVREGEPIEAALRCFERVARQATAAPWVKRRLGYYEKPSVIKRKRGRVSRRNERLASAMRRWRGRFEGSLKFWMPLAKRLRREGPFGIGL